MKDPCIEGKRPHCRFVSNLSPFKYSVNSEDGQEERPAGQNYVNYCRPKSAVAKLPAGGDRKLQNVCKGLRESMKS